MDVTILRNKKTKNFPELSLYLAEIRIVILKVLMQIKSIAELGHSDVLSADELSFVLLTVTQESQLFLTKLMSCWELSISVL